MQPNLHPSPNSSPRQSPWKWIALGVGAFLMLCCGGPLALLVVIGASSEHTGGVQMSNEVEPYVHEYIQKHELLEEDEKLIAYYDDSISLDGSEAALLTTRRLLYHKKGRTTAMLLKDVVDVKHREEGLTGDIIEAVSRDGERMRIEIAPLNDGKDFLSALRDHWKRARQEQGDGEAPEVADDAP